MADLVVKIILCSGRSSRSEGKGSGPKGQRIRNQSKVEDVERNPASKAPEKEPAKKAEKEA